MNDAEAINAMSDLAALVKGVSESMARKSDISMLARSDAVDKELERRDSRMDRLERRMDKLERRMWALFFGGMVLGFFLRGLA